MSTKRLLRLALPAFAVTALMVGAAGHAQAAGFLVNGASVAGSNLAIGVHDQGHLNIPEPGAVPVLNSSRLGLAARFADGTWRDSTSPGCFCEGWGVSASGTTMFANVDVGGVSNITLDSFVDTSVGGVGGSLTSSVHATSLPGLMVVQKYELSTVTDRLFKNTVTITNTTGGALTDVRYVRVMDWDIPPTEFDEAVTHVGTATTTALEMSHDDGFASPNPLAFDNTGLACPVDVDFTDCSPTADHGSYFRFNFGALANGASLSFTIFYGGAATEAAALAALGAAGVELYSLGQQRDDIVGGTPQTYMFAFKGVGGVVVIPTPEPGSLALLGSGLAGLGWFGRRRRG